MWKLFKHPNFYILCFIDNLILPSMKNADLLVCGGVSQIQYFEKKSTIVLIFLLSLPTVSIKLKTVDE